MEFLNVGGRSWEDLALAKNLIHMGHNCNHLEIHEAIHEAMIKAIEVDDYRNYAPPYGFAELRDLIKNDLKIPGAEVMVTQGATEAIYQAMASILEPGDETIVADPGWPHIGNFARMLKSDVVEVPIYSSNVGYKLQPDSRWLVSDQSDQADFSYRSIESPWIGLLRRRDSPTLRARSVAGNMAAARCDLSGLFP